MKKPDKAAAAYVALLRGINVGGKNKLPMKDLVRLFEDAGCRGVRTYIQSGNVVFEASSALAKGIAARISQDIAARFGLQVPVVMRSATELASVVEANPYLREGADPRTLHVAFLATEPSLASAASLDPKRSAPDEFVLRGRDLYLRCPNGMARTKLTNAYFDSKLSTTSTMRNWNTVLELLALCRT